MAKYAKNARKVEIYKDPTGKHWEAHTGCRSAQERRRARHFL